MKRTREASRNARHFNLRYPAILLFCAALTAQAAQAGESPYRPPASYYVCNSTPKASTRYYSDVFPVPGSGVNYQQITGGFENYVSAKYGVKASAFCHGDPDQNKMRSEEQKEIAQLKNAKWHITETGWKYSGAGQASASSSATPAAAPAQSAAANANSGIYWICSFSYYSKPYLSDVITPADAPGEAGQVMGELVQKFTSYLVAKHGLKPHVGSGSCIYQGSAAQAQNTLHHMMTPGAVATGWKP